MVSAAKFALLLGVLIVGLARVAAAQRLSDSAAADPEPRLVETTYEAPRSSHPPAAPYRLLWFTGGWIGAREGNVEVKSAGWLPELRLRLRQNGPGVRTNGPLLRVRKINRRFLPIPLLRWQHETPLGPRGVIAVNPSLVLGRRQTYMPDVFRGGRTFGVAVEMKIRFDGPDSNPPADAAADPASAIVGRLRGLLGY